MLTPSNLRILANILENKEGYEQKSVEKFVTTNLKIWLKRFTSKNFQKGKICLSDVEFTHIQNKNKILAIKEYRNRKAVDLITAKNEMEQWMMDNLGYKSFGDGVV